MSQHDSPNPEFDPKKYQGISKAGEASLGRPPEVKAARKDFVDATNGFLRDVQALQARGGTIEQGGIHYPIETEPRVKTHLGRSALGQVHGWNERTGGISLSGDGETSPLVFNAVLKGLDGSSRVIEIAGTNPMLPRDEAGGVIYSPDARFDHRAAEAKFTTETVLGPDRTERTVLSYSVGGDGRIGSPATQTLTGGHEETARLRVEGMQDGALMIMGLSDQLGIPPATGHQEA